MGLHKNALQLVYKEYDEERLRKEFGDLVRVKCFACFLNSNSRNHYCYCMCDTSINILGWWIPKKFNQKFNLHRVEFECCSAKHFSNISCKVFQCFSRKAHALLSLPLKFSIHVMHIVLCVYGLA